LDIPHGVALDVIPLDGYAPTKWKRWMQCFNALIYSLFCAQIPPKKHGGIMALGSRVLLMIFYGKKLRYRIWMFAKRNMTKYPISDSSYITELCSGPFYMKKKYRAEWFSKNVYVPFEETQMPIPVGFDGYLREAFGDYEKLPPKEEQKPHHDYTFLDLNNGYDLYQGKEWLCAKE
jgi:lipopolysaccharide cholinephosphotransferase